MKAKKPKILLYGKPGVGKTWAALDFPAPYYIDTEGGATGAHYMKRLAAAGGVHMGQSEGSLSFETVIEQVEALATQKHGFKTLIIDSITKIFLTTVADSSDILGVKGSAYGADKKQAYSYARRLVRWLERLDMSVVLVAHEVAEYGVNEKGERVEVGATHDAWPKLAHELDLSLNIVRLGSKRIARVSKSRLENFPNGDSFPWSFEDFTARYGREAIERASEVIVPVTAELAAEIAQLVIDLQFPQETLHKWMVAAGAGSIDELPQDKAEKILAALKKLPINPETEEASK